MRRRLPRYYCRNSGCIRLIARMNSYPDSLDYEADFKAIVRAWRSELAD
jgi:hypothetical protein